MCSLLVVSRSRSQSKKASSNGYYQNFQCCPMREGWLERTLYWSKGTHPSASVRTLRGPVGRCRESGVE